MRSLVCLSCLSFHLRSAAVVILRDSGVFFMLRIGRVFDSDGRIFPCTVVAFLGMIWGDPCLTDG